ncbi:alpha/beta fold hydrolase [Halomonas daqiaonensis]|uniref:Pimeloyl-ACP methyl ester carboxylesterase n=1 Tax=Halomonas daqiaonensis TaxID=650850 RepID=A0A1H7NXM7_9GAMM|nr:alpha/beta hydrolase [Halomonas daqiaonensis]SEL28313.1 Pimeloyl-ACP methyl ester carboxylesterase [Halomonas daqiaonensis]
MGRQSILRRNNVTLTGSGSKTLMLLHGFGCDQNMWRFLVPALGDDYRLVLLDYVGMGKSDLSAFDPERYDSLEGYAQDILDVTEALELDEVTLIGHSVSGIISLLAAIQAPERFSRLIMLSPSPCFLNMPPDYYGGFEYQDLKDLIDLMDKNYIGWASTLAPLVMGTSNDDVQVKELTESFCSTDPLVAKTFAKATFFSDYRHILPRARHPVMLLQSSKDTLAAPHVGRYMHDRLPDSELRIIDAEGHCPHMSHPQAVLANLQEWLPEKAS